MTICVIQCDTVSANHRFPARYITKRKEKAMYHYMSKPVHIKCISSNGHRLSPVRSLTYDTGLVLHDRDVNKDYCHRHNDGTVILYSEIFNYRASRYTDKSIPVAERLSNLASDVYNAQRQQDERTFVRFHFAVPFYLTDEQLIELTAKLGNAFSTMFKRPIVLAIHKKEKGDTKNYHVHMTIPERGLDTNDRWQNKRAKIYKDWDGNLIYDKNYKNSDGSDKRKPIIDSALVPNGDDPYKKDANGNYVYQKRVEGGRRKWDSDTSTKKWLEPQNLVDLHKELDNVMNQFFIDHNIDDRVIRIDAETRETLKKLGLRYMKIGPHPTAERIERATKQNMRYRVVANVISDLNQSLKNRTAEMQQTEKDLDSVSAKISQLETREKRLRKEIATLESANPVVTYIEKTLQPQKLFVENEVSKATEYISQRNNACNQLMKSLYDGYNAIKSDIAPLQNKSSITEREKAQWQLWSDNNRSIGRLHQQIKRYRDTDVVRAVTNRAKQLWRNLNGWQRVRAIRDIRGSKAGEIYKAYLKLNDKMPAGITVPHISLPNTELANIQEQLPTTIQSWNHDMRSPLHRPPIDTTLLNTIANAEKQLIDESIPSPVPANYSQNNLQHIRTYRKTISAIEQQEAEIAKQQEAEKRIAKQQTATGRDAVADAVTNTSVSVADTNADNDEKKRIYKNLSDLRQQEKIRCIRELLTNDDARNEIYDKLVEMRNIEDDKHHNEPDYEPLPILRKSDVDTVGLNYILKRSIYMNKLFMRYGIDRTEFDKRQADAFNYYQENIAKTEEQAEKQKKGRLKPKSNTKTPSQRNDREK